jgi:hypothetical protein
MTNFGAGTLAGGANTRDDVRRKRAALDRHRHQTGAQDAFTLLAEHVIPALRQR